MLNVVAACKQPTVNSPTEQEPKPESITNTAFIAAVERAMDSEGNPVNIGWTKEADGTVKLTPENLEAIRAVTGLYISVYDLQEDEKLTDLSGIEYFTGLTYLNCGYNNLTTLDVSDCTALTSLSCSRNNLTTLNVTNNTALTRLNCGYNNLQQLDIRPLSGLSWLYCTHQTESDGEDVRTQLTLYLTREQKSKLGLNENEYVRPVVFN